jgi:hypothetical protein
MSKLCIQEKEGLENYITMDFKNKYFEGNKLLGAQKSIPY